MSIIMSTMPVITAMMLWMVQWESSWSTHARLTKTTHGVSTCPEMFVKSIGVSWKKTWKHVEAFAGIRRCFDESNLSSPWSFFHYWPQGSLEGITNGGQSFMPRSLELYESFATSCPNHPVKSPERIIFKKSLTCEEPTWLDGASHPAIW